MGRSRIVVGTSSWADPGFVEEWYPPGLPARERLPYYAQRFDAVEVNSTFYAVPAAATVERWVEATPDGFVFDWKLHKLLSRHSGSLKELPPELRERVLPGPRGKVALDDRLEAELARATLEAAAPLADAGRLGGFLLQLTPGFGPRDHALDELSALVEHLDPWPVAVELRNRGWVRPGRLEGTLGWFEDHRAAWVGVDAPRGDHFTIMPPIDAVTDPRVAYLRAHGRNLDGYVKGRSVAERFAWRYSDEELEEIAGRARELAEQTDEVRVYMNNNRGNDAPVAAERLRELLGQGSARPIEAPADA